MNLTKLLRIIIPLEVHAIKNNVKRVVQLLACANQNKQKSTILKKKCISKSEFNKATAKLIINTASPFSFVEHKAFIEFCTTICNQIQMNRKTLMKDLKKNFEEMKIKMNETFKNIEWVCVTADLWTCFKRYVFFSYGFRYSYSVLSIIYIYIYIYIFFFISIYCMKMRYYTTVSTHQF